MRFEKIAVLSAAVSVLLSGCGSFGSHSNVDSGFAYIENHDYQNALEAFQSASEEGEDECLTHRGLGIVYLKTGEYATASEELLKSLSADTGIVDDMDFDTNFYLAESYIKQGDYDSAKEVYDAILTLRPKDTSAHYLRGTAELAAGNHDDAYSDFTKAIALNSRDYTMMIMIYKSLAEYGYNDEASSILQKAIDNGSDFMSNYEKGQISFYLGNNADAQSYLEAANSERDQDKEPVVLLLGQTGEKQGDYNYAISVYRNYLSENPDSAEIYNQLGMCQIRQGDYESAISSFEAGLALDDKNCNQALKLNEITAKEYSGDFAGAKSMMTEYLAAYPDDPTADREMVFLDTRVLP